MSVRPHGCAHPFRALLVWGACVALGAPALSACDAASTDAPGVAPDHTSDRPAPGVPGPTLRVDDAGYFVSTAPVVGSWWPGAGVPCLVPLQGDTDGRVVAGRIDGATPLLWTRAGAGGAFEVRRPVIEHAAESLAATLRAALGTAVDGDEGGLLAQLARRAGELGDRPAAALPPPAPPPPSEPVECAVSLPEAGTPLLAYAPTGAVVAHVRSVEAGYRFAGLADDLARVLAPPDIARRDFGTLRMTLHGLLLPAIWGSNPGGQKGVSECALVVLPPVSAGRLGAALLQRVVDPDNQRMDMLAGVALEARPGHLWRPADDPFPLRRVRDNVRAFAGDIEITAAGREVLARIDHEVRPAEAGTPEAIAARWELPPAPGNRRALVLELPQGWDVGAAAEVRVREGVDRLAEVWTGLSGSPTPAPTTVTRPVPAPWRAVRALCADTDRQGAAVAVRLDDAASASALAAILRRPPPGEMECLAACSDNLRDLVLLALVEPHAGDVAERSFVWFGFRPVCLSGGTYGFHPITGLPSCSLHGERDAPLEAVGAPPSPISEVVEDGSLVSFRLRIDWSRRQ